MNQLAHDGADFVRRRTSSRIVSPADIDGPQRTRMHDLISHHYENVSRPQFEADLDEKDSVVLIEDDTGQVQGFTTLRVLWSTDVGEPIAAIYSGDTLLSPDYMGERGWLSTWARHVFGKAAALEARDVFWVFAASSHRVYRFLPGFFLDYYPHPDRPTPPAIARILQSFIEQKFTSGFDPARGIVSCSSTTPYRYPEQVAGQVPSDDRFARFFIERNPQFLAGELLACITRISEANVTPVGRRVLAG
jgi:hypothetical protein